MSLNAREIASVVESLDSDLTDSVDGDEHLPRVREIHDDGARAIYLTIRIPGRNLVLAIDTQPNAVRLHLCRDRARTGAAPAAFTSQLRKCLVGTGLKSIAVPIEGERVVRLEFVRPEASWTLIARLTGRSANLLLLDVDDVVRGAQVLRTAGLGAPWQAPAPCGALDIGGAERLDRFTNESEDESVGLRSEAIGFAIERHYAEAVARAINQRAMRGLRSLLKRERKRLARRVDAIEGDRERAKNAERDRELGDLLAANFQLLKRGMDRIELADFYREMARIEIALDPRATPRENVDRHYARHRKYRAALPGIRARLSAAEDALLEVESIVEEIREWPVSASSPTAEQLNAVDERLAAVGIRRERRRDESRRSAAKRNARAKAETAARPYREFRSASGITILVGKSARDNDQLTFRVARGNDLWLHAAGSAGSHVIVRLGRGQSADQETLVDAATLAAHYSKAKRASWTEVHYTQQKFVKKAGAPGRVTLSGGKTMDVRLDEERLRRLMTEPGS